MELKENLTNEKVCKKFTSQFELVNYAIKLAVNMISTGRDSRVKMESQNRASQILGEILQGKDHFDEIIEEVEEEVSFESKMAEAPTHHTKNSEGKKSRKRHDD